MKKLFCMSLVLVMVLTLIAGCSGNESNNQETNQGANQENNKNAEGNKTTKEESEEPVYLEVWNEHQGLPIENDGVYSSWLVEQTGVGVHKPQVPWNGGTDYLNRLNTRIASGNMPDMFTPWGGIETQLIEQGAVVDLTDLLPEYAPNLWNQVPEEVWKRVGDADPSGEGRIYYVPLVNAYTFYGSFIRQDWLDTVGMEVPTTQEEYVEVLRAFKSEDANNNGDPNDEVPVSGREFGRWMDHLFGMYGVATWEGYPMWEVYDGELTYSAVTPNMRDAIVWIKELYEEGLLDSETFLNSGKDWLNKIHSDKTGSWYHIAENSVFRMNNIYKVDPDVEVSALGIPKVDGYDGFITNVEMNRPYWVIANKSEEKTIAALKLLDWAANPANTETVMLGVPDYHHDVVDGKPVVKPFDPATMESIIIRNPVNTLESTLAGLEFQKNSLTDPALVEIMENAIEIVKNMQPYGKPVAGDGMPARIFEEHPDIKNHILYQEYMTKIIIGEYDISKFDEFVEKWNAAGGAEVTKKAREWYSKFK